ncbi:ATP-binding protein [Methanohalophilus profundi]|uniref:ATP-binding protein n=1 Tax=Methanohalophilus profundi TaxID=2138083 RepID=UPI00101C26F6|nr:ATP-binding protein [Methanohalophilus profundi]
MSDNTLDIIELLLTAQIYNQNQELDVNDLPKPIRKHYWKKEAKGVPRPIHVSLTDVNKLYGESEPKKALKGLPFVEIDEVGYKIKLTSLDMAISWFEKQDTSSRIEENPALAYYYEKAEKEGVSYSKARDSTKPKEVDREWIESLKAEVMEEEGGEDMLKLAQLLAPEDIQQGMSELILTKKQESEVDKIVKAIKFRDYLKEIGLYDVGKVLLVGPPGTGKTSVARALSEMLSIPFVEVKLSMITDQYLGETAKNIDRVFELAKKLNPCILFVDEFDFIAKTRTSDEHAALKRAVNTLLKAIDEISLTRDGVLLIAATNHPHMLDSAAWRRFDEILEFPLPDYDMRKNILDIVTRHIKGDFDTASIAEITEGYSGSDLRVVIREGVLDALLEERRELNNKDLLDAVESFNSRSHIKSERYLQQYDRVS